MQPWQKREVIADKALGLLTELKELDPDLMQEQMKDANRIMVDAGLFPNVIRQTDPEEFVTKLFRVNQKLDEVTNLIPLARVNRMQQLSELANLLTGPFVER